ncbi:MAG: hypothetical protein D6160_20600 [Ketobacter sp.]|nr:MAG: hypothetical protein D6160_20600 [Ketobacter sp.]
MLQPLQSLLMQRKECTDLLLSADRILYCLERGEPDALVRSGFSLAHIRRIQQADESGGQQFCRIMKDHLKSRLVRLEQAIQHLRSGNWHDASTKQS